MSDKTISRIMIMGAGAVGGYFGGKLAHMTDKRVSLIARGAHLDAIKERGLEIQSPDGSFVVKTEAFDDPEKAEIPDLVLMTVKSYDTDRAISRLKPVISNNTILLSIQNGLENHHKLVDAFGRGKVIPGFCVIGAGLLKPGVIQHNALGIITAGEFDNSDSKRLAYISNICEKAGIQFNISEDIQHELWVKFTWNSIFNIVTVITDSTVDRLFKSEKTVQLLNNLFEEIRQVAEKEGVILTENDRSQIIDKGSNLKGFVTSTLRDRRRGKRLEFEAFTGYLVRLADKHDITVPHSRTLYGLLQVIA